MGTRQPEWRRHGDPRCADGLFIPKDRVRREIHGRYRTQAEFARAIGVGEATMARMLSGDQYMSDRVLVLACAHLGMKVSDALEWPTTNARVIHNIRRQLEAYVDACGEGEVDRGLHHQRLASGARDAVTFSDSPDDGVVVPDFGKGGFNGLVGDYRDPSHVAAWMLKAVSLLGDDCYQDIEGLFASVAPSRTRGLDMGALGEAPGIVC